MPRNADVVISWFANVSQNIRSLFQRDTVFINMPTPAKLPKGDTRNPYTLQLSNLGWPHPLRRILGNYAPGVKALRVCLIGFSEGCQGLSGMLRSDDAGFIDTVIAMDGIHSSFIGGTPNADRSNISIAGLAPWIEYSKIASNTSVNPGGGLPVGRRNCIISHSSIIPIKFVSTTATAEIILNSLFGDTWPAEPSPSDIISVAYNPPIILHGNSVNNNTSTQYPNSPTKYASHKNGLYVFGFNDNDPTGVNDHIYQANVVLPEILTNLLIPNWNNTDPIGGVCIPVSKPSIYTSASYSSEADVSACSVNPPTIVPNAITDPNSQDPLPDGKLNYDKWIPPDEKKTDAQRIKEMMWYTQAFFTLLAFGLGYAGVKATDAIVNDSK